MWPECSSPRIVRPGDNLWTIARECRVPFEGIIAWNPQFPNPNLIRPGNLVNIRPGSDTGGPLSTKPATSTHPDGLSAFEPRPFTGQWPQDISLESGKAAWFEFNPERINPGAERTNVEILADLPPQGGARIRIFVSDKIANALADGCGSENNTGALRVRQDNLDFDPRVHMIATLNLLNREGRGLLCVDNISGGSQTTRLWINKVQ